MIAAQARVLDTGAPLARPASEQPTDFALLEAWRGGDRAAGSELLRRHFRTLYRFFSTKAGDAVDDLVQRTFLGCIEARDRFRGDAKFKTFLLAIAHRQLVTHYRKKRRVGTVQELHESSIAELGGAVSKGYANHDLLVRALQRIPLDFQMSLELYYWEGMTMAEVAEVLDVPEGTIKSRLSRGRGLLRRHLVALQRSDARL